MLTHCTVPPHCTEVLVPAASLKMLLCLSCDVHCLLSHVFQCLLCCCSSLLSPLALVAVLLHTQHLSLMAVGQCCTVSATRLLLHHPCCPTAAASELDPKRPVCCSMESSAAAATLLVLPHPCYPSLQPHSCHSSPVNPTYATPSMTPHPCHPTQANPFLPPQSATPYRLPHHCQLHFHYLTPATPSQLPSLPPSAFYPTPATPPLLPHPCCLCLATRSCNRAAATLLLPRCSSLISLVCR